MIDEQTLGRFVTPNGRIQMIPAKHTVRLAFLEWLANDFDAGVEYPEATVNEILLRRHDDYAALRRYLVEMGHLTRENNIYKRETNTI